MRDFLFTSESVSRGHPDKIADQISDAILDKALTKDRKSYVACETLVTTGMVVVAGEMTTQAHLDIPHIARKTIQNIGYVDNKMGFDYKTCAVISAIGKQSEDIAEIVHPEDQPLGAGDQGLVFGYAVNETTDLMPMSIQYAHRLVQELDKARKDKRIDFIWPDSKSQVTVEYQNGLPKRIDRVVISTQHIPDICPKDKKFQEAIRDEVIEKVLPTHLRDDKTKYCINPSGKFVTGGPMGDCGMTGRKVIVDTYGGHGAHGGGAFSGKDPSKVDRSAAYATRHIAKNIVKSGLASKCLLQISYVIGQSQPISLMVNTFGTGHVNEDILAKAIKKVWDLSPAGIIQEFDLLSPKYLKTATYGHFGRSEEGFTWENTNKVEALKEAIQTVKKI